MLPNGLLEGDIEPTPDVNLTGKRDWQLVCGANVYSELMIGKAVYKDGRILINGIDWFKTSGKNIYYFPYKLVDNTKASKHLQTLIRNPSASKYAKDKGYITHKNIKINNKIKKNVKTLLNKNIELMEITPENYEEYLPKILEMVENWKIERSTNRKLDVSFYNDTEYNYRHIYRACKPENVKWVIAKHNGEIVGSGLDEISDISYSVEMQTLIKFNSLADLISIYLTKTNPTDYRMMGWTEGIEKSLGEFKRKYAVGYLNTYFNIYKEDKNDVTEWFE